jgi:hypothetical protein
MHGQRIQREVHRILFKYFGVDQRSHHELRSMPRGTSLLVAEAKGVFGRGC